VFKQQARRIYEVTVEPRDKDNFLPYAARFVADDDEHAAREARKYGRDMRRIVRMDTLRRIAPETGTGPTP
jgi:hypothetical protein